MKHYKQTERTITKTVIEKHEWLYKITCDMCGKDVTNERYFDVYFYYENEDGTDFSDRTEVCKSCAGTKFESCIADSHIGKMISFDETWLPESNHSDDKDDKDDKDDEEA